MPIRDYRAQRSALALFDLRRMIMGTKRKITLEVDAADLFLMYTALAVESQRVMEHSDLDEETKVKARERLVKLSEIASDLIPEKEHHALFETGTFKI